MVMSDCAAMIGTDFTPNGFTASSEEFSACSHVKIVAFPGNHHLAQE
jgi:hypothetical protein